MLSHLYRMVETFRRRHGYCPNLLYLNRRHYQWLRASLSGLNNGNEVRRLLGMDILIASEIEHPDVAYRDVGEGRGAGCTDSAFAYRIGARAAAQGCAGCGLAWTARRRATATGSLVR